MSFKEELDTLKNDFSTFQTKFLELVGTLESKYEVSQENTPEIRPSGSICVKSVKICTNLDIESKTRSIIEQLMWQGSISEAVISVRETFRNSTEREKFIRSSIELVFEKNEHYRRLLGTLLGRLIDRNVITELILFDSLSSFLLVVENESGKNGNIWHHIAEVVTPLVVQSHIRLGHLRRVVQTILKPEYYQEFDRNVSETVENYKTGRLKVNPLVQPTMPELMPKVSLDPSEESIIVDFEEGSDCREDVERMINDAANDKFNLSMKTFKRLLKITTEKHILEEMLRFGLQTGYKNQNVIGNLLCKLLSQKLIRVKDILIVICNIIRNVEQLILNSKTRQDICFALAAIFFPLHDDGKIRFNDLEAVANITLPEEVKNIFLWYVQKVLYMNELDDPDEQTTVQPNAWDIFRKKAQQKRTPSETFDYQQAMSMCRTQSEREEMLTEARMKHQAPNEEEEDELEDPQYQEMRRKKLLKERVKNRDGALEKQRNNKPALESKVPETAKDETEDDHAEVKEFVQTELLPSDYIKEKMIEFIEQLVKSEDIPKHVDIVKQSFNECQSDQVFKAAFVYTKNKTKKYRFLAGTLIAETYKKHASRVGPQVMNTISLELGDFEDCPEFWTSLAEIISPAIIHELVNFNDFKLLPKYFLCTESCYSLMSAVFRELIDERGKKWLEENWRKTRLDLSAFLPATDIEKFVNTLGVEFCLKHDESNEKRA